MGYFVSLRSSNKSEDTVYYYITVGAYVCGCPAEEFVITQNVNIHLCLLIIDQDGVADFWLGARCEFGLTDFWQFLHVFLKMLHHVIESLEDHP